MEYKKHDLPRSVVKVEKLQATQVGEARDGQESVYLCPFCVEKRTRYGKEPTPDTVGKLFVNNLKEIGLCFRCNTIVLSNWTIDSAVNKLANVLEAMLDQVNHTDLQNVDISTYPLASSVERAVGYIQHRNPSITTGLMDALDLRWYSREFRKGAEIHVKEGILTPMRFKENDQLVVKCFQIRFLTHDKNSRFYTLDGIKSVFFLRPPTIGSTITLCEGTWDAIALGIMGFPNPVALLGKSLSAFQANQLRQFVPSRAILALDDEGCNTNLRKDVRNKLPSVSRIRMYDFRGHDPEEYLVGDPRRKYRAGNLGF